MCPSGKAVWGPSLGLELTPSVATDRPEYPKVRILTLNISAGRLVSSGPQGCPFLSMELVMKEAQGHRAGGEGAQEL